MITKKDLIERIYNSDNVDCWKYEVEVVVNELFDELTRCILNGEDVKIKGFGKFYTKKSPEKKGVNPRTQEPRIFPARRHAKFKSADNINRELKEEVED